MCGTIRTGGEGSGCKCDAGGLERRSGRCQRDRSAGTFLWYKPDRSLQHPSICTRSGRCARQSAILLTLATLFCYHTQSNASTEKRPGVQPSRQTCVRFCATSRIGSVRSRSQLTMQAYFELRPNRNGPTDTLLSFKARQPIGLG
ncbi:hypothetical protein L1887_51519 [Cichorium endivia]|nr:hypothetical protein L1887_51519 [Cichorium endivia]